MRVIEAMNVLYVNHYAGAPKYGMALRVFYFAREWVKSGHNVYVVGANYSHLRSKQPSCLFECIDNVNYQWVKTPPYKGNGARRLLNMLIFIVKLFLYIPKFMRLKPSVVIASSTYPLDIFPCWVIAKLAGAKLVFELHDLWPLSPMLIGNMSKYNPFIVLMRFGEYFSYRLSDKIVSILPHTYEHIAKDGVPEDRFIHIPNGIFPEEWESESLANSQVEAVVKDLKLKGKTIVCYAGAHGPPNALDNLISAAELIKKMENDVAFVLIGTGTSKDDLVNLAKSKKLSDVYFCEPIDKKEIPETLRLMDILYIGAQKEELYRFGVSPNKLFDYMMAGKPIISAIDAANDIVSMAGCGITVPPGEPAEIVKAIEQIKSEKMSGISGIEFVKKHHDISKLAATFLQEI